MTRLCSYMLGLVSRCSNSQPAVTRHCSAVLATQCLPFCIFCGRCLHHILRLDVWIWSFLFSRDASCVFLLNFSTFDFALTCDHVIMHPSLRPGCQPIRTDSHSRTVRMVHWPGCCEQLLLCTKYTHISVSTISLPHRATTAILRARLHERCATSQGFHLHCLMHLKDPT